MNHHDAEVAMTADCGKICLSLIKKAFFSSSGLEELKYELPHDFFSILPHD